MFEELFQTFEECREPNWDGFSAQPVSDETYHLAVEFLKALRFGTPAPFIGAEPNGHLTVEWYRSPHRTLSVSIGRDGDLHYAALLGTEKICGTEAFRARMPLALRDLIARIVEQGWVGDFNELLAEALRRRWSCAMAAMTE